MPAVEVIAFPNVERALVGFLNARLTARSLPAWVSTRVPADRPPRLVTVTRSGGGRRDIATQTPFLLFQCWDATDIAAEHLASVVAAEVEAATRSSDPISSGVWIGGTPEDFSAPVNFPDPDTRASRYQFTASLTITGYPL